MVACAGERHREQNGVEAGEPVLVHVWENPGEPRRHNAVAVIEEEIPRHQRNAGVNQRRHIAEAEDFRALDVEIFRQQHDADANDIHRDDEANRQFQRIQDVAGHVAREEEADDRQRVDVARAVRRRENLRDGVQAWQEHEAEKQVDEERNAEHFAKHPQRQFGGFLRHIASSCHCAS